jgi:uncharacterized protein YdhG (YjbR/CyaY superfamily)
MTEPKKSAKGSATRDTPSDGFTEDERAAIKERAQELRTAGRRGKRASSVDDENDVLGKIAEMSQPDRGIAERIHAIVKANAPALSPKLWYGMPAYAKDGKNVCFFQTRGKFKTRYATFGFNDTANLDDGTMWPVAFAITELTADDEATIAALVKRAAG